VKIFDAPPVSSPTDGADRFFEPAVLVVFLLTAVGLGIGLL